MKKQIFTFIFIVVCTSIFAQKKGYSSLEEALENPEQVYYLYLSSDSLTEFPKEILQFKNLETLYLLDNQLTELPPEFAELQSLKALMLTKNQFSEFPKEILQLKNLEYLHISENQIRSLPAEIGELKKLRYLSLSRNQLESLPTTLETLQSLHTLEIDRNQFSTFPLIITQLQNLETLYLDHNQLTELPTEIGQLQSLEWLKLDDNQLTELPIEIVQLQSLEWLELTDNQLTELPAEIVQLQNLERLELTNNQFSNLPNSIAELQNVEYLYVDGNNISETDLETLKQILPNCKVIFWQNGLELLEKEEWVQVITDIDKSRDIKFSVKFEKDMLRLQADLLSKGKYKQNLYKDELLLEQYPDSDYERGWFTLIKGEKEEKDLRQYFIVGEHKTYITLSFISEDEEMAAYLPYYSKSKYEALHQLPTKKKLAEKEFLEVLDEIMLILNTDREKLDLIYVNLLYEELNFFSMTDLVQRVFEKQGYNPFTSVKAYNKAYDKYENLDATKERMATIQGFFDDDDDEN